MSTLRNYRQKCRVSVTVGDNPDPIVAWILFDSGYNDRPIGDTVYLHPNPGTVETDKVTLLEVLDWQEPPAK